MICVPYNVCHFDFKYILITSMGRFQLWQTKMQARFAHVASYFPQQFFGLIYLIPTALFHYIQMLTFFYELFFNNLTTRVRTSDNFLH